MILRRAILAFPIAVACSRRHSTGFSGYAFVANEEGKAIAAVDLEAFAVAKHISLDDAPSQVVASADSASVFAVTPRSGSIHEIQADRLSFKRKLPVARRQVPLHAFKRTARAERHRDRLLKDFLAPIDS